MKYYLEVYSPTLDEHVEVEVTIEYDAWYQEAKISGPPEDCYPSDGELDITGYDYEVPEGLTNQLILTKIRDSEDKIVDAAWEHFHENR